MDRYKSVRINKGYEKVFEDLQKLSKKEGTSVNELINKAVEEYIKRRVSD